MDLFNTSVKGIKWVSISRVGRQGIQFVTIIIIANLIAPKDFGIMASAMIFINFINSFRDFGIGQAIIQHENFSIKFFSSLFWFSLTLGSVLTVFIFLVSQPIASILVHTNAELIILSKILKVLSIGFFFSSIVSIQLATLERMFNFSIVASGELISAFIGAIVSIILAAKGFGVWSLVFQSIVSEFILLIMLGIFTPHKPKLSFDFADVKEVFSFSSNLLAFNFVNYLARNFDYFLISKFLGSTALGYYSLAYRIMFYPIENITNVLSRVLYPVYSKIQKDNERFRKVYKKVAIIISSITFPLILGLMLTSNQFVDIFFNDRWSPIVPLILLLSPVAILQSLSTTTGSIYKAKARTDVMFKWGLINSGVVMIAFAIGVNFGVNGVASGYLIANLLLIYFWLKIAFRLIDLSVLDFLKALVNVVVPVSIMGLALILINYLLLDSVNTVLHFISAVFIGVAVYLVIYYKLNHGDLIYYRDILLKKNV